MKAHVRIIPWGLPLGGIYYSHIVAHFDGRGKWKAHSYCKTYQDAKKTRNAAAKRYSVKSKNPPNPRVDLAGASPAQVQRVVGQTDD